VLGHVLSEEQSKDSSDEMMTQNQSRKYVFLRSNNLYKHNLNQSFVLSKNANLGFLESITVPKL